MIACQNYMRYSAVYTNVTAYRDARVSEVSDLLPPESRNAPKMKIVQLLRSPTIARSSWFVGFTVLPISPMYNKIVRDNTEDNPYALAKQPKSP